MPDNASALAPNPGNLYIGRGKLYLDIFTAGTTTRTGELDLGNVTSLELTMKDDVKEKYESMDHSSLLYGRAPTRRTVEIKVVGDEYSLENLANVMMGDQGTISQTGATVTGETITASAVQGRYYPTAKRKISAVTVKVASVSKTLGTDYTIDAETGRIYIVPGGGIAAAATVTCDYTYATIALKTVRAANQATLNGYLRFVGDPVVGPTYELEVWNINFTPEGNMGFIADDFGNWTLSGMCIADLINHPNEPYYRVINRQ